MNEITGQLIADQARTRAGLSAASNWQVFEVWLDPFDTPANQRGYALGYPATATRAAIPPQSCCTKALLAFARDAGRTGTILWRGQRRDVLRMPQADGLVGQSPQLARALGEQHGILQLPTTARPEFAPGVAMLIGGDDGLPPAARIYGGLAHGILVTEVLPDGTFRSVEGGKGPGGTAVAEDHRELFASGGHWWVRTVGAKGGRRLRWWYQLADLPEVGS